MPPLLIDDCAATTKQGAAAPMARTSAEKLRAAPTLRMWVAAGPFSLHSDVEFKVSAEQMPAARWPCFVHAAGSPECVHMAVLGVLLGVLCAQPLIELLAEAAAASPPPDVLVLVRVRACYVAVLPSF